MADLIDREAEQGVVGAFLLGLPPDHAVRVRELVPGPEMFGTPAHGHLYACVLSLLDRGSAIDPLTLRDEAARLLLPCDLDVVADCADAVPTASNAVFHAGIVRDRFLRRELTRIGNEAGQRAKALDIGIEQGYAETVQTLVQAAAPALTRSAVPLGRVLGSALTDLSERGDSPLDRGAVSCGLPDLDTKLGGLAPGRLIVLAARPGIGKTSLALHMARHVAEEAPVFHVSLEMGDGELAGRLLCAEAQVGKRYRYTDHELTQLQRAAGRLSTLPYLVDTHADTPGMIRLAVQAQIAKGAKPGLVVVDYLQLLRWPGKTENRNIEIGKMTRFFKRELAMGLNVPVLLLSQLSRANAEGGKPRPPGLTDLRDSGNIEQDADQVLMLHYAGAEDGRSPMAGWDSPGLTEVYVRKNRDGSGGLVKLGYDRPTGVWRGWGRYEEAAA